MVSHGTPGVIEQGLSSDMLDRADSIVLTALGLAPEDRLGYLDRICASSAELRNEVESLLYLETDQLAAIDEPVFQIHMDADEEAGEDRIGPYRVGKEIGRGGVATVYQGRRFDDPDRRILALKVLRRGLDSAEVVRGLRREGQILAQLAHPFIGRVYGGGLSEDHRPYLVMEFIEGETLDRYCRHQCPDLRTRLELFLKLCEAVDYAHQRLVVHSDIKPSNVLITEAGEPRLLDFGIARLLDASGERSSTATSRGRRMLTPAYASPEQVRQRAITTATDVYALGVVLYELLSGLRPLDLAADDGDWRRVVCEQDPPPPSRAGEAQDQDQGQGQERLRDRGVRRRLISPDLDAITTKALRKEPEQRYSSVRGLADDLRDYLAGRPVAARRGNLLYRAGKRARRHRTALAVSVLILAMAATFLVDRQRQLERVRSESAKASAVRDFLLDLLTGADPLSYDGDPPTVRELLDRSHQQLDELEDRPEIKAAVMGTLGEMYSRLGDFERAEPLLSASLEYARQHPTAVDELIQALLRAGEFAQEGGDFSYAIELLEECMDLLGHHPKDPLDLPRVLGELGLAHRELGRAETAARYMNQALADLGDRGLFDHPIAQTIRNNLGLVYYDERRYADAAALWRILFEQRRQRGDRRMDTALTAINLVSAYTSLEDYAAAEAPAREAHRVLSELLGPNHPNTGAAALALARVVEGLGDTDAAIKLLLESKQHLDGDGKSELPVAAAQALELAKMLSEQDPERALEEIRRGRLMWQRIFGAEHPLMAEFHQVMAKIAVGEEARSAAKAALDLYRQQLGEEHPTTVEARQLLDRLK